MIKALTFKTKILFLVIVPLILVSVALTTLSVYQAQKLGDQNVASFSDTIIQLRRAELKNYTEIAYTAIEQIYQGADKNSPEARRAVVEVLRPLKYAEDGYFFLMDYEGVLHLHPTVSLEGVSLWDTQDPNGVYLARALIENARNDIENGGFTDYIWDKPSKGREVSKVSYSYAMDDWDWIVGTGLYIDDLEETIDEVKEEVSENITNTLKLIAGFALGCTILVALIGGRFTMSEGKLADQRLQQLSRKSVEGQEEERSRVARELQKGINKALYLTRERLQKVTDKNENEETRKEIANAVRILERTIKEVYRISGELRPEALDKLGLYSAVEALVDRLSRESNIKFTFKTVDSKARLRGEVETTVYRIIQEAVKNILNHSEASTANIRMHQTKGSLSLTIQDDGIGFNAKQVLGKGGQVGVGFVDIRVRVESLGGSFSVFSSGDIGTVIKVTIPL